METELENVDSSEKNVDIEDSRLIEAERNLQNEREHRVKLESALKEYEKIFSDYSEDSLKKRHENAKNKIKEAYDAGDTDLLTDAQDELSDVRARMVASETQKSRDPPKNENVIYDAAKKWVTMNPWFTDPSNNRYAAIAHSIEQDLVSKGYTYDEKLYKELDAILEEDVPKVMALKGRGRSTIPSQGRWGEGSEQEEKSFRRLTKEDLSAMRKYGFDPDSAKDRKNWIERDII